MAEIVQGLFGVSPESLMAQREQAIQQQALQASQMGLPQQARYAASIAGSRVADAAAGLLGGQDPAMVKASALKAIASKYPQTPEGYMQMADEARAAGFIEEGAKAAQYAQSLALQQAKLVTEQSTAAKNLRERASADPVQQLLRTGKYTPASVSKYATTGNVEDLAFIDSADKTQVVETADGQILINKTTGQPIANIGRSPDRRTTITTELKQAPDVMAAVNAFPKAVEKYQTTYDTADTTQSLINQAVVSKNSQAFESARTTLAAAVGQTKLSNEDIKRTGVDPRLVAGALDWLNKKIEGVPNEDIQKQMYAVATALKNKAAERINEQSRRAQEAAKASGFKGDPSLYFPSIPIGSTPAGALAYTDPAKEAAYQAWKQKQAQGK